MESVFRSRRHPGSMPAAFLFGQALGRPLGICMLPAMIAALVMMLQGIDPMPALWVGAPVATVVAWFWTAHQLKGQVAEIRVDRGMARFISPLSVAGATRAEPGEAILDVRARDDQLSVTVGLQTFQLYASDWPEWSIMENCLRDAQEVHVDRVRTILEH